MSPKKNRVTVFDTTLRDGEQSPGASLNHRDKLEIARQLSKLGVDIIEAGFPIASPDDFRAVKAIAESVKRATVCGLARCVKADIDRCAEAVAPAAKPRIHVFLATSAIHRQYKLRKARSEIIKQAVAHVKYARKFCDDVEFSPEDASRTEPDFLAQVVEAVVDAGAGTVNIPDTVGYAYPDEFGALIAYLFDKVPNINDTVVSVHCHNDLGLAVANSLAAVKNGARTVECTINGLGERAGNCAMEEFVMTLRTRSDLFDGIDTGIKATELSKTSRMVSQLTGLAVQRNKAIVGANAFAHESGVHQDGMLKERTTYEIMRPQDVGIEGTELVLGKHSGRHAFRHRLTQLGVKLEREELERVYVKFLELADKKKEVYDDDLLMLAREEREDMAQVYLLDYMHVTTGTDTVPTSTVRLKKGDQVLQDAACGDGPVDAVLKTIDRMTQMQGKLLDYSLQAITVGKDAMGEVSMTVVFGKDVLSGKSASTDIVEASARAYLSCVNRLLWQRATADKSGKASKTSRAKKSGKTSGAKKTTRTRKAKK